MIRVAYRRCLLLAGVVSLFTGGEIHAASRLIVRSTGPYPDETPILVELPRHYEPGGFRLRHAGRDRDAGRAQIFRDRGKTVLAVILDRVTGEETATYDMVPEPDTRGVAFEDVTPSGNLRVIHDGKLLTEYRTVDEPKPYLFPVIGPTGAPVTRAYPMKDVEGEDRDHPHQRSFWFTHGKVNGVDFWSEEKGHGTIRETAKLTRVAGPVVAVLRTTDDWIGPDGQKVCEDERVYRFYDVHRVRILDLDVTIKAVPGPLTFGDTKEGMFGLRVASSMDVKRKQGGKITNAEGLTDLASWGKPSEWVDYTGPVSGRTLGIAILNHPTSFRSPTNWHVRDYGLFAANPFGWHDFGLGKSGDYTISEGETITFRYRVLLHEGDTPSGDIPGAFRAYAKPPQVRLQE
jgi:hypothetical protein